MERRTEATLGIATGTAADSTAARQARGPTLRATVPALRGAPLVIARMLVACVIALCVGAFAFSLPGSYALVWRTAVAATRHAPPPSAALSTVTVAPDVYAGVSIALGVVVACGFVGMALLILNRRSDEAPALLAAATLVSFGVAVPGAAQAIASGVPVWEVPLGGLQALGWALLLIFAYAFPDGRFLPRWTRYLVPFWVLWVAGFFLFAHALVRPHPYLIGISFAVWVAWFATGVLARAYRYLRLAGPVERQQTKWVALGGLGAIGGVLVGALPSIAALTFAGSAGGDLVYQLAADALISVTALLIPLTIGIAILRHRLFDVDLIINRTLVYGSLTALLAAVYLVSVVLLQALTHALTGQRSESALAIVLSTLLIAALFQPLRLRVQRGIDRRFYRRKYDALKTVERFAHALGQQVELDEVRAHLIAAVEETLQPAHISLWLRPPPPRE